MFITENNGQFRLYFTAEILLKYAKLTIFSTIGLILNCKKLKRLSLMSKNTHGFVNFIVKIC